MLLKVKKHDLLLQYYPFRRVLLKRIAQLKDIVSIDNIG